MEKAERVSERSWEILIPTIRKAGSEIWVTFNPAQESELAPHSTRSPTRASRRSSTRTLNICCPAATKIIAKAPILARDHRPVPLP
ncbi:MAG: phage terminase large subunit [Polyangia bacterium]